MTDLCLGCDEKECICLEVHESEFDMNKNLATLVHSPVPGHKYIIKHLFGDGVQVEVMSLEGNFVNIRIVQGFMRNTLAGKKWGQGDELGVPAKSAKFYEVQG